MRTKRKNNKVLIAIAGCVIPSAVLMQLPGSTQTQLWNVGAREKSQRLSSSAQNELTAGRYDSAIPLLIQANQADPKDPLPLFLLGLTLNIKGRYQEALDSLRKAYQLDDKYKETYLSVGFTNYLAHQYDKALDVWERLLKVHPDMHQVHSNLGFAHLRMGDMQQSEEQFRRTLKAHPNSQLAYQGLATLQYLNGNLLAARQSAQQAQAIQNYPPVLLLLARIDALEGKMEDAQKRLADYARLTKRNPPVRSMTAVGYLPQHDFHWDPYEADNFDSGTLIQLRLLGGTAQASKRASMLKKANADEIMARIQTALSTAPSDYFLLNELGLVQLAKGDYLAAAESFSKAAAGCSECHVVMLNLASALALAGKGQEARAAVANYKEIFPNQPLAPHFINISAQAGDQQTPAAVAPSLLPKKQPGDQKPQGDAGF